VSFGGISFDADGAFIKIYSGDPTLGEGFLSASTYTYGIQAGSLSSGQVREEADSRVKQTTPCARDRNFPKISTFHPFIEQSIHKSNRSIGDRCPTFVGPGITQKGTCWDKSCAVSCTFSWCISAKLLNLINRDVAREVHSSKQKVTSHSLLTF
jgi:hypothetical protein